MINIILNLIGGIILLFGCTIAWKKLLEKKVDFKSYKLYLTIFMGSTFLALNSNISSSFIRIILSAMCLSLIIKIIFDVNFKICLTTAFYTQIINLFDEVIFSIILVVIFKNNLGNYSTIIVLGANIFVGIMSIILVKINFVRKIYKHIIEHINRASAKTLLNCLIPIIFVFNIYLAVAYYKHSMIYVVIANSATLILISIIIYFLIKKENEYNKVCSKYNTTLNSLKEYEYILDKYRISNHENKNQILTIRNMITKKNKKAIDYIDEIIKNKLKDDDRVMMETAKIPNGGLRGLIYSKILVIKSKKIDYKLKISNQVRIVNLINFLDNSLVMDICKIVGVYLDNSIQAVENIKTKIIHIEMYIENKKLIISISNTYEGKIEINKIEMKGYTSKENGHGYGLTLAKEIIDKNKKLCNEKRISKDVFTQILKVSIK